MAEFKMYPSPVICNDCGLIMAVNIKNIINIHNTISCINSQCKSKGKLFKLEYQTIELEELK